MVSWSGTHNFFRWRHLRHFTIWIILAKPWNRKIAVLMAVPVSEKILAFFRHLVSLFITSPCILAYFVWLFGKNFQETEKKLKYFGARMFWINFVPRTPSSRRCVLIKVYFLRSVWHLKRIILRKSAISQCIWPLSLVFTFFFSWKKIEGRFLNEWSLSHCFRKRIKEIVKCFDIDIGEKNF